MAQRIALARLQKGLDGIKRLQPSPLARIHNPAVEGSNPPGPPVKERVPGYPAEHTRLSQNSLNRAPSTAVTTRISRPDSSTCS